MKYNSDILKKIDAQALVGRGGACFSVAKKWLSVKENLQRLNKAYIIVNAAEGEPGVKKDAWLLNHKADEIFEGISLAWNYLGKNKVDKIYFYLSKDYFNAYSKNLKAVLNAKKFLALQKKIIFFLKPIEPSYISGEETAILNIIEGKKAEPRIKPPYPIEKGLFNNPTLIHNVETFYNVAQVASGNYQSERLYTLAGAIKNRGVFSLPAHLSIEEILRATNNYPNFTFFVMSGGGVCGELWRQDQLNAPVEGSGLVMVFDYNNTDQDKLVNYWLKFYQKESCGACAACREGTYRLLQLFTVKKSHLELSTEIIDNLEESSLCALGPSLALTIKSYLNNINN